MNLPLWAKLIGCDEELLRPMNDHELVTARVSIDPEDAELLCVCSLQMPNGWIWLFEEERFNDDVDPEDNENTSELYCWLLRRQKQEYEGFIIKTEDMGISELMVEEAMITFKRIVIESACDPIT